MCQLRTIYKPYNSLSFGLSLKVNLQVCKKETFETNANRSVKCNCIDSSHIDVGLSTNRDSFTLDQH